ncbi:MAG: hypothetical protein M3Q69_13215 [Acidobacteriota bacterium]|nr:hypothetical protein [Acidobacteriota bacterium]
MGLLVAFVGGVVIGIAATRAIVTAPDHAYRTRAALPLKEPGGRTIGELPANTLVVSHLRASKSEHGWWALVPLLIGDGSDAVAVLRETEMRQPIPSTEMLLVQHSYRAIVPPPNNEARP